MDRKVIPLKNQVNINLSSSASSARHSPKVRRRNYSGASERSILIRLSRSLALARHGLTQTLIAFLGKSLFVLRPPYSINAGNVFETKMLGNALLYSNICKNKLR